jgi:hypothetical protein
MKKNQLAQFKTGTGANLEHESDRLAQEHH